MRILRFFRFYSIFGKGEIDAKALLACRKNQAGLKKVSIERIRDEYAKIMLTPNVAKTVKIMHDNDILGYILPPAQHLDYLEKLITLVRKESLEESALRRLFILYMPDEKLADSFATRLKFSRKQKDLFVSLARYNPDISEFENKASLLTLLYKHGREFCEHKYIILCAVAGKTPKNFTKTIENIRTLEIPVFSLKGRDIIEAGVKDNRKIGTILSILEQMWMASAFSMSKEDLLSQVHGDLKRAE